MNDDYQDQMIFAVLLSMASGWFIGGTYLFTAWVELVGYETGLADELRLAILFVLGVVLYIAGVLKLL